MTKKNRHLLASYDLQAEEVDFLLKSASALKSNPNRILEGKQLALLFEKPSLRTRVSFQVAMRYLGGETTYLAPQEVGLGEREAIKDVARVLSRYLDIIAVRTFAQEIVEEFAKFSSVPVINALTNEEHPCQALADLFTLYERVGTLKGFPLAFIGDGNNVASSLVVTAASLGLDVRLATPKGYLPSERVLNEANLRANESGGRFFVTDIPEKAVEGAQAVYTDTWVSMGQEREAEQRRIVFKDYQVNKKLLESADDSVLVMHDLPAHRGEEITDEVFEGKNSIIFDQAENRTWAQAAVVAFLLGTI
ncbi:MAG: ornithine carbamoyltransferase [Dehalococcoidia bacterium]|nr:ornithine carbamoyltransferase [Dehalococcoidia bacterium]|tara:strand:- start:355 stop:1275 length:921 start_codon:yes stop_codon:yes gene_type:complete